MSNWFWSLRTPFSASRAAPAGDTGRRSRLIDALHVFVLLAFGLAQPIYDRLGERAALFIDQRIGMSVAYLLVLVLSVGIPGAVVLAGYVVNRWGNRAYFILHTLLLFCLLLQIALPICKFGDMLTGIGAVGTALCLAAGCTWLYLRFRPIRSVVTLASPGIILFPLVFLLGFSSHFRQIAPVFRVTDKWNPVPVVVLVCDEFCGSSLMTPDREIDARRFPNFAALARDGTWFRNATSANHNTEQAVPAILSGRYATTSHKPIHADLPQNLFSVLDATGAYEMTLFEPVTMLAPMSLQSPQDRPQGLWAQTSFVANCLWRVYLFHLVPIDYKQQLPRIPLVWFGMHESHSIDPAQRQGLFRYNWAGHRKAQFQHLLDCFSGTTKPTLHFMHVLLPHMPWSFLPSERLYAQDGDDWELLSIHGGKAWGPDELESVHNQQRYLLQVMCLDRLIGRLVARLKATGMYDRCLLIVTADHGISFRPGQPRRDLVPGNQDEILSIPLFVKHPGKNTGGTSDRNVEAVDVFPTVAEILGIELLGKVDGWSVFDASRRDRIQKTFGDVGELRSVDPAVITKSQLPSLIRRRFGDSSDPASFFRIGPIPELIGRTVDSLPLTSADPIPLQLVRYGDEVITGPDGFVPCLFEGSLKSSQAAGVPTVLAVVINGTLRAVTRTYLVEGPNQSWSAMVPESAFHAGQNDVRFYTVTGTSPDWQLNRCDAIKPNPSKQPDS